MEDNNVIYTALRRVCCT